MKVKQITIKFEEYEGQKYNREEVLYCNNTRCSRNNYCAIMRLQCDPYYYDERTALSERRHNGHNYDKDHRKL